MVILHAMLGAAFGGLEQVFLDYQPVLDAIAREHGGACTALVRLVASGRYRRPGISPPEFVGREPGCWPFVRAELARRGVVFEQEVLPVS